MAKGFWGTKLPIAIAHRGGAGAYQLGRFRRENTLEVFKQAADLGFKYLELDTTLTKDGKVIVVHVTTDKFEALLHKPSAPNARKMQQYTYAELKTRLKRNIPTLATILRTFPDSRFLIDAKTDEVVEPLAAEIIKAKAFDRVFLNSFYLHRVARLKELLGDRVTYGLIIGRYPRLVNRKLHGLAAGEYAKAGLTAIILPYKFASRSLVDFIHQNGLKVVVWTPNTPSAIKRMLDFEADGIISDRIDLLKQVLESR